MIRFKIVPFVVAVIAVLGGGGIPVRAEVEIEIIAVTGEFAPGGGGGQFHRFDRPVLNENGDIAFRAKMYPGFRGVTESNNSGIWRKRPHTRVHKIARAGDYTSPFKPYGPQPEVTKAQYGTLGVPQIGPDGRITFLTELALPSQDPFIGPHNNEMIFTMKELSVGFLDVAQEKGSKAPILRFDYSGAQSNEELPTVLDWDGYRSWFDKLRPPHVMADGTIVFTASLQMSSRAGRQGIWHFQKPAGHDPEVINPMFSIVAGRDDIRDEPHSIPGSPPHGGTFPEGATFKEFTYPTRTPPLATEDNYTRTYFHATLDATDDDPEIEDLRGIWLSERGPNFSSAHLEEVAVSGIGAACLPASFPARLWDEPGVPHGNQAGRLAFHSTLTDGAEGGAKEEGIFLYRYNRSMAVALSGDPAIGFSQGAVYESFDNPVISPEDHIAFVATVNSGDKNGDLRRDSALLRATCDTDSCQFHVIARSGDVAPGSGGANFSSFGSPLIAESGILAFAAQLAPTDNSPASHGVWIFREPGGLALVAMEGTNLDLQGGGTRAVKDIEATGLNEQGQVALRARFDDGTEAVVIASTEPPPPPDFTEWVAGNIPDPAHRGTRDDPDGDGRPNFLELAFGGDPNSADPERSPTAEIGFEPISGSPTLDLIYYELSNPGTITYQLESSPNLFEWETTRATEIERVLLSDGTYRVRVREANPPQPPSSRYLRITVTDS